METELGEELEGENCCLVYQQQNQECWVYSHGVRGQIKYPGNSLLYNNSIIIKEKRTFVESIDIRNRNA